MALDQNSQYGDKCYQQTLGHAASPCPAAPETIKTSQHVHPTPHRLVVVTARRAHVYSMQNLTCLSVIDTEENARVGLADA
jgi:hypothetical protein